MISGIEWEDGHHSSEGPYLLISIVFVFLHDVIIAVSAVVPGRHVALRVGAGYEPVVPSERLSALRTPNKTRTYRTH